MLTITPRSPVSVGSPAAIAAADNRNTLNVPIRLMEMTVEYRSRSWGVPSRATTRPAQPTPAQFTAIRSGPSEPASSIAAVTSPATVTSVGE